MPGIYIHIPFCKQICNYCDFHRSPSLSSKTEVLAAISRELETRKNYLDGAKVRTLYFGGGTPSVCTPAEIAELVLQVKRIWGVSRFDEVTFEANPDDLTPEYLAGIKAAGIDRLSIGIQSFDDSHLRQMNRRHTGQDAVRAVENARQAGFDNITIDLIYGLPFMSPSQWQGNLDLAAELGVQHISAYHLTIEPKTVFAKRGLAPVSDQTSRLHFDMLREKLVGAGFEHYEVSNFALPGRRAVHNSLYWTGETYLGAGPSAHSFNGTSRQWNPASNKLYLERAEAEIEILSTTDRFNEMVMTRLRTSDGLSLQEVEKEFSADHVQKIIALGERFVQQGVMFRTPGNTLALKPENFLISDSVISSFFE